MTKQANILNKYELKSIVMSDSFDCNKFYKHELGSMIDILKEENKQYCCKRNECSGRLKENHKLTGYEIIDELEKWLEEEKSIVYRDCGHTQRAYQRCYDKLKKLKGE